MRARAPCIVALALASLPLGGCGGGGSSSAQQGATKTSQQVFKCLFVRGFKPVSDTTRFGGFSPAGGTAPGYQKGLAIKLNGVSKPVIVSFYSSSADAVKAERFDSSIAKGTKGGAVSKDNVVLFHGVAVPAPELSRIEGCAL